MLKNESFAKLSMFLELICRSRYLLICMFVTYPKHITGTKSTRVEIILKCLVLKENS